ncbi:hypothetical protein CLI64_06185 [Nostoc sp. CENA543]|uniref:hypothetical protein n=1 Tax=Nostoc sp. CENA543 TaxID=1869241 RepID=UPI000CA2055E|nr:hypothetical protein [Nostoc sp. CENA543]AUT00006.1 hypothetical protein CLI64_06185 [Nostoc sp. CENA543]
MDIRLIKKSEKLLMEKIKMMEEAQEQSLPSDNLADQEPIAEEKSNSYIEAKQPYYIPQRDYPLVQSVGNSGWQVSDIWRDIRVDNFCDD